MSTIVFIRHGATAGNLERRYIGRTDEPLCDIGIKQAMELRTCNFPDKYVFVSPMKRTLQTAELIFPESEWTIEEDFKETDFGIFEGKNATELLSDKEYGKWLDSMCMLPIPGGEKPAEFKHRCVKAFKRIIKALPFDADASFVVHGGVIMSVLEAFSDGDRKFYDYHIKNGEYVVCKWENNKLETGV